MKQIPYPEKIDYELFNQEGESKVTRYGLPSEVRFCKKCVMSNQRTNSAVEHTEKNRK